MIYLVNENITQVLIANAKNSRQLFEIILRFISNRANKRPIRKQKLKGKKIKFKELNRQGKLESIEIRDKKYFQFLKKKCKRYGIDFNVKKMKLDNDEKKYQVYFKAVDKEALERAYKEIDRYFESKIKKKESKKEKKIKRSDKKEKSKDFWEEYNRKDKKDESKDFWEKHNKENSKTKEFTESKVKNGGRKESLADKINRIKDNFGKKFKNREDIWQRKI